MVEQQHDSLYKLLYNIAMKVKLYEINPYTVSREYAENYTIRSTGPTLFLSDKIGGATPQQPILLYYDLARFHKSATGYNPKGRWMFDIWVYDTIYHGILAVCKYNLEV